MVQGVNLLYHEATFPHDMLVQAQKTMHTTALEAANVAKEANVGKLVIGHYSARIKDEQSMLKEAKSVFPNVILAQEGLKIDII